MDMYTLLCLKWTNDEDLWWTYGVAKGTLFNVMCKRSFDMCICMAESLCWSHEIIKTTLLISYTPT